MLVAVQHTGLSVICHNGDSFRLNPPVTAFYAIFQHPPACWHVFNKAKEDHHEAFSLLLLDHLRIVTVQIRPQMMVSSKLQIPFSSAANFRS